MGRLTMAILTLIGFHIGLYIFTGSSLTNSAWVLGLLGLENWAANPMISFITSTIGLIGTGAVLVAAGFLFKSSFPVYAGVSAGLLGMGMAYAEIYQRVRAEGWLQSGANGTPIFIALFFAPLLISWFIILLEFMRGGGT